MPEPETEEPRKVLVSVSVIESLEQWLLRVVEMEPQLMDNLSLVSSAKDLLISLAMERAKGGA